MIDTIKNNSPESTRQHEVDEIEDSSSGEAKSIKEKNNFFVWFRCDWERREFEVRQGLMAIKGSQTAIRKFKLSGSTILTKEKHWVLTAYG